MAKLSVMVDDAQIGGDRRSNVALIKLMSGDTCLMTEVVQDRTTAPEKADAIRKALGLLKHFVVLDANTRIGEVWALDLESALIKLVRDSPELLKDRNDIRLAERT